MSQGLANTPRLVRLRIIGSVLSLRPIRMLKWSVPRANWKSICSCASCRPDRETGETVGRKDLKKVEGM